MKTSTLNQGVEILEARIAPAGIVNVLFDKGQLLLTGDDASNRVAIYQTDKTHFRVEGVGTDIGTAGNRYLDFSVPLKSITINAGGGDDSFDLHGLPILKSLAFNGGAGDDAFFATDLSVKGALSLNLGTGADYADFGGLLTRIGGNFNADFGAGGASLNLHAATTALAKTLTLTGGDANDVANLSGNAVKIGKGIVFNAGEGTNALYLDSANASIGKLKGLSVAFRGGTGDDQLSLQAGVLKTSGGLQFQAGDGVDVLRIEAIKTTLGKSKTARESIAFESGAGDDFLSVLSSRFTARGSVSLLGGGGANSLIIDSIATVIGKAKNGNSVSLTGSAADLGDRLELSATDLKTKGSIQLTGSDFNDRLAVNTSKVALGGNVIFSGGGLGADQLDLCGRGTIKGAVSADLGGAPDGLQSASIKGALSADGPGKTASLLIKGGVTLNSEATAAGAGEGDLLTLINVSVKGAINLKMGNGTSTVDINNLLAAKNLTLNAAGGQDLVRIETEAFYGSSQFKGAVNIQLGLDDDTLLIGAPVLAANAANAANSRAVFLGGLFADGADGANFSNDIAAINAFKPGVLPTLSSFKPLP